MLYIGLYYTYFRRADILRLLKSEQNIKQVVLHLDFEKLLECQEQEEKRQSF